MQYRKDQEQRSQVKECRICKERQGRKKRLKATEKKKKKQQITWKYQKKRLQELMLTVFLLHVITDVLAGR